MNNIALGASIIFGVPATIGVLPSVAMAFEDALVEVQHNNGSLLSLNGEFLPFAGESFPVLPGDVIEFSRGFSDFSLLIAEPETTFWDIQVFPGDRFASFDLEDLFISTEPNVPVSFVANLPSGQGNIIAYGFDPVNESPVVLTALGDSPSAESVPEPQAALGLLAFAAMGYAFWGKK